MMSNAVNSNTDIRWQCRRGMLELDLLLNNFVDKTFQTLTPQQRETFDLLLSYPDQTLLDLLLGNAMSSDPAIADFVKRVRATSF